MTTIEAVKAVIAAKTDRLKVLEIQVGMGLEIFITVAESLAEIRDDELWRAAGYETWGDYLDKRWHFGTSRARQLINGGKVARHIESVTGVTVRNESEARQMNHVLRHYPETVQDMALAGLAARGGELTPVRLQNELEVLAEYHTTGHVTTEDGEQNALVNAIKTGRRNAESEHHAAKNILDTTADIMRRFDQEDGSYIVLRVGKGMAANITLMKNVRLVLKPMEAA